MAENQFEIPKEKMHEMDYWQSIYIIYKEHKITTTDIDANDKNKIMMFSTDNGGSDNDNNNNENYNETITN